MPAHVVPPLRLVLLLVAIGALSATTALAGGTERDRLDRGEILVSTRKVAGSDMPEAIVKAVVDAPPANVWKIVDDCGNYRKTMPRIEASRQLERGAGRVVCEITVDITVGELTATTEARYEATPARYSRRWHMLKGDYHRNDGSWVLTPFGDKGTRTMVEYRVHAEPRISVPNFLLRRAQASALPDLIQRLRKESGAR